MPKLDELLAKAQQEKPKKTFPRGNRPDRIASGNFPLPESSFGSERSEFKVEPNRSQSEVKVEPIPESKWSQSEAKVESFKPTKKQSRAEVEPEPEPKVESKWSQTEAKVESIAHSSSVVGLQKKTLTYLYESCRFSGSKISPPFAIQNIAAACGTSVSATKKALQRLEQKHFLRRAEYKDGRSGWTRYQLPDAVYSSLLQEESGAKLESKWSQTKAKVGTKVEPEPEPTPSSSSSSLDLDLNKLTNTTVSDLSGDLSSDWDEIDSSPLSAIRFGRPQLAQLARVGNLTVEQLQESIYAFAFDLEVNGKGREINGHALNYFMGILRRGPYAPSSNYEAPDVRQLRLYLEAKKREQQTRLELESQLEAVEFDSWMASLSTEERARFVPVTDFAKPGSPGHNVQLKQYFRENVWPELRTQSERTNEQTR